MELLDIKLAKDSLGFYLFDKIALGVLLLLLGTALKYVLELVKMNLAVRIEASKQRVAHIGEVWSAVYKFEGTTHTLLRQAALSIQRQDGPDALQAALRPLEQQSKTNAARVKQLADENRFWLDKTAYRKVQEFYNANMDLIDAFADGDLEALQRSEAKLTASRVSIADFA